MARCCASLAELCMHGSRIQVESDFVDIAENQPEVLARHYTEAGLIEKAALLWGKAGRAIVGAVGPG